MTPRTVTGGRWKYSLVLAILLTPWLLSYLWAVPPSGPQVYFSQVNYVVYENQLEAVIKVETTDHPNDPITVFFNTANGTAVSPDDYASTSGQLTLPPGINVSEEFKITIVNDGLSEGDETVKLILSAAIGADIGSPPSDPGAPPGEATLTIKDPAPPPPPTTVYFEFDSWTVNEGDGSVTITVKMDGTPTAPVSVSYSTTTQGVAAKGFDFEETFGTLEWDPSEAGLTKSFTVNILEDQVAELMETIQLSLSNPVNAVLGPQSNAVINILDNDLPPIVQFSETAVAINESAALAIFTVSLNYPSSQTITVDYGIVEGGTAAPEDDFLPTSGTLTFAPGEIIREIQVVVVPDNLVEEEETVQVGLLNPTNAFLGQDLVVLTIWDDAPGSPRLEFAQEYFSVRENDIVANITVILSEPSAQTITVDYETGEGGSATPEEDFQPTSKTLSFAPGEISKEFQVIVVPDAISDPEETVLLALKNPVNAGLGFQKTATLEIEDGGNGLNLQFINAAGEKIETSTGFSHPRPVVKIGISKNLNDVTQGDLAVDQAAGTITVHIFGRVYCGLADVTEDRSADIQTVTIDLGDPIPPFTVPVLNESTLPVSTFRPFKSGEGIENIPHPFEGWFEADVVIPMRSGSVQVAAWAENVLGRKGHDLFTVTMEADESGYKIVRLTNDEGPGPELFHPIWVCIQDPDLTPENFLDYQATFFDTNFSLIQRDGKYWLDRPFLKVALDGASAPNIRNVLSFKAPEVLTYKSESADLDWSYTAASPPSKYYYAAGTTVRHNWYSDRLNQGWNVRQASVWEKTGQNWNQRMTDAKTRVTQFACKTDADGNPYVEFRLQIEGKRALPNPEKRLEIFLTKRFGALRKNRTIEVAEFDVVQLKTIIVGVDGLGYDSAKSVISGDLQSPTFKELFGLDQNGKLKGVDHASGNWAKPALAAMPTVTFSNWPGIFSGQPPKDHGWTGNAFFPREISTQDKNESIPFASSNQINPFLGDADAAHSALIALGESARRALTGAGSIYGRVGKEAGPIRVYSSLQYYAKEDPATSTLVVAQHFTTNDDPVTYSLEGAGKLDEIASKRGNEMWLKNRHQLDVLTLYFSGPDVYGHAEGGIIGNVDKPLPALEKMARESTDPQLKKVVDQIKKDGYFNTCLFVLVSDHGLIAYKDEDQFKITSDDTNALPKPDNAKPELEILFTTKIIDGGLDMKLWRGDTPQNLDNYRGVYSPNGGMAQLYFKDPGKKWTSAPRGKEDLEMAAKVFYFEAIGQTNLYPELAPLNEPKTDGALGSPPALFLRKSDIDEDHFNKDFRWVKGIKDEGGEKRPILRPIPEFLQARADVGKPVNWPEFESRIKELNHQFAGGSRTGDLFFITDATKGYMAVNQRDGHPGWHGGPTQGESYVPLIFSFPGDSLVLDGKGYPQFLYNGFNQAVTNLNPGPHLRNWQCAEILANIVGQVRKP